MSVRALIAIVAALAASPASADFSLSFEWGSIPRCTSGNPNRVDNPRFIVRDVPSGTERIEFRLRDLDAPDYNHGGGTVTVGRDATIPPGAFRYLSPCPPNGIHTYEWTATARRGNEILGRATARSRYP